MRRLIADIYKILYKITRERYLSLIISIVYITILNLITIQGLGRLLEGWMSVIGYLRLLFRFPYIIATTIIMLGINFLIMLPLKNLKKERQKKPAIIPIVIYTVICFILVLYMQYSDKL